MNYIYIIGYETKKGPLKIGFTNNPIKRLKTFQTGQDKTLSIHYLKEFNRNNARLFEQIIHSQIKHLKVRGEWFDISINDAISEIDYCIIRYENQIEKNKEIKELSKIAFKLLNNNSNGNVK